MTPLIRINPREQALGSGRQGISLATGGLAALHGIAAALADAPTHRSVDAAQ